MDPRPSADRLEEMLAQRAWVQRVARALVLDQSWADDLEQETWLRALQNPPPRPARAWLGTVLRNAASDMRRGEQRRAAHEGSAPSPRTIPSPETLLERAEIVEQVARAVRTLDEPYRTAVLLRYFEDLSPPAIAAHLGVPIETVRTRLRRALALLRERLDREHQGDRRAWALMLLPLVENPRPLALGSAASAGVLGGILMTLKAGTSIAAVLVLILGGWLLLGRKGDAPLQAGPPGTSPRVEGTTASARAQVPPGGMAPAQESSATSAATTGAAATPLLPEQKEARILRVFCGFERATIIARFHVCGGDPDPAPVVGRTDASGTALLPLPLHPNLLDGFEVEGRADGYMSVVVRLEEFPKAKSVTLQMLRGQLVSGRVVDERGVPVSGARVEGGLDPVETGADGAFEVAGYGSAVWLRVRHKDFLTWSSPDEGVPMPSSGVELRLSRGLTVSGRVTFEDGKPAPGAKVLVELEPLPGGPSRGAKAGTDGTYVISGFSAGDVRVKCDAGTEAFSVGLEQRQTVKAGAEDVNFVLKSSLVHVRVLDEAEGPFRNAELICWWLRDGIQVKMGVLACKDGETDIEVPPGTRLTVASRFRGYATGMAEVAAERAAGRREVVVRMRRLGPPGRIEILATDPMGRPVRKIRVTLLTVAGLPLMWFGGSRDFDLDARGAGVLDGVPAQLVEAEIAGPFDPASETEFLVPWRGSFLMKDGGTERLTVAFRVGGRLRVRVVGPDGNPANHHLLRLRDSGGQVLDAAFWDRSGDGSWSSPPREGEVALYGSPIPAGTYRIEALTVPFGDFEVAGSASVEIVEGKVVETVVRVEK